MTPLAEPVWLTRHIVETLQLGQIREHGGQPRLRDPGLLDSALARPRHLLASEPETDLAALAAEYGFGLAKNRAFRDGNKRIALVAMNVFLVLNGYEIEADEPVVVTTMLRVAAEDADSSALAEWIRGVIVPYSAADDA